MKQDFSWECNWEEEGKAFLSHESTLHKTFSETIIQKLTWARAYHEAYKSRSMKRRFFYDLPPYQSSRLRNCEAVEWQTAKCPSLIPFRPRSFVDWLRSSRRAAVPVVVGKPDKIYIYVRVAFLEKLLPEPVCLSDFISYFTGGVWHLVVLRTNCNRPTNSMGCTRGNILLWATFLSSVGRFK